MRTMFVFSLATLLLMACNDKPPEKTVFDTQVEAIKKTRAVEGKLQDAVSQQQQKMEQDENGASTTPSSQ